MSHNQLRRFVPAKPASYARFIMDMRAFVESKNVSWHIPLDSTGIPYPGKDWDLRKLTDSHSRIAARTNGFAIDDQARANALAAGSNIADIVQGDVLNDEVCDFIKALIAYRCSRAQSPKSVSDCIRIYRKFFSATAKMPWDLNTEDFDRFLRLDYVDAKVPVTVANLANIISENLLSLHCPIVPFVAKETTVEMQISLADRKSKGKLPDLTSLFELTRIVFQEIPKSHMDLMRFAALRLLILTGLRINEVLMLPLDCLSWTDHFDVVTGLPAESVGGVGKSLRLRYFGEKHSEGAPDILVEEIQWIPRIFQEHVVGAVLLARKATADLRTLLAAQHASPAMHPRSDLRYFRTNIGTSLNTADLLFLVPYASKNVPKRMPAAAPVALFAQSTFYHALNGANGKSTIFTRYSKAPGSQEMRVNSHSLRHLMNTELFRQNVPDTIITHQFGRQTVAQSYEYDHRTLAERLRFVRLPDSASNSIQSGTHQELVAKMVVSGLAAGSHIGKSFKVIQAGHGDSVAFEYIAANSDGFHVTPYGICVNSFSLNPCARHLKCFDNCKHYVVDGSIKHRESLEVLKEKLVRMRDAATAKAPGTLGRKNQISHASRLIDGVSKALEAQPRTPVFPQGVDHSALGTDLFK